MLDTIGIPKYNVYGEEINEEIYYKYNVFVYSNPENMYSISNMQRFKEVPNEGKSIKNGVEGEYYLLGRSYSGATVANVYFPVDAVPETLPDKWNYLSMNLAYESWFDKSKYKYKEQIEYSKNSNLLFDSIDYSKNVSNPYKLISYDITPLKIGLDKVMLNACPTWKTYGVVTVNRLNDKSQVRYATLAIAPMAASATVKSDCMVTGNNIISGVAESCVLNINFSASAINLTDYATKEQIKNIWSILYINDEEISRCSGSKTVNVDKNILFTVSRKMFSTPGKHKLHIKVVSYLYTEFSVDGLMEDIKEFDIYIDILEKIVVPVINKNAYVQKYVNNKRVVSPLVQTIETNKEKSYGLIEQNRNLAIKLELSNEVKKLENIKIYVDNVKKDHEILYQNDKYYLVSIKIGNDINKTLATWSYLRNKSDNYFNIDFNQIGSRIKKPCKILIKYEIMQKEFCEEILVDIIDNFEENVNFIFENNVVNKEETYKILNIGEL